MIKADRKIMLIKVIETLFWASLFLMIWARSISGTEMAPFLFFK